MTPGQLLPGNAVLVIHPGLGELLSGYITQQVSVENRMIHFYNPDIPPVIISDCHVMPHACIHLCKATTFSEADSSELTAVEHPKSVYEFSFANIDRQENWAVDQKLLTAFQFLNRKREIVNTLHQMNDLAQSYIGYSAGEQIKYSDFLITSYTQLVLDLEETDRQLKLAVSELKGGGVAASQTELTSSSSNHLIMHMDPSFDDFVRGLDSTDVPAPLVPAELCVTVQPLEVHQEYARRIVESLIAQPSAKSQVVTNAVALYSFLRNLVHFQAPCELGKLIEAAETLKTRMHAENDSLYHELFTLVVSDIHRALTPRP